MGTQGIESQQRVRTDLDEGAKVAQTLGSRVAIRTPNLVSVVVDPSDMCSRKSSNLTCGPSYATATVLRKRLYMRDDECMCMWHGRSSRVEKNNAALKERE